MSEPDIQIQRDYPQTLVNSQWVKWAAERIAELEQQLAELREAVDMAILKHRIRREKDGCFFSVCKALRTHICMKPVSPRRMIGQS